MRAKELSPGNSSGNWKKVNQVINNFIVKVIQDIWETLYLPKACLHSVMQKVDQAPGPEAI